MNILQQDQVWTLWRNDYSEQDVTIIISVEGALLCEWPEAIPQNWETSGVDTSSEAIPGPDPLLDQSTPLSLQTLAKALGGHPWIRTLKHEYLADIGSPTHSDTDTEDLKKMFVVSKPPKRGKHTPDMKCPDYEFVAVRGSDLYYHIKELHLKACSYACWDCEKNFQTDHDRLNHMNAIHCIKGFRYTVCAYSAATEARMINHVRTHAVKKFECATCEVKLVTKAALRKHTLLHLSKEEIQCSDCEELYASKLVLSAHKHGGGTNAHCVQQFLIPPLKKLIICASVNPKGVNHLILLGMCLNRVISKGGIHVSLPTEKIKSYSIFLWVYISPEHWMRKIPDY